MRSWFVYIWIRGTRGSLRLRVSATDPEGATLVAVAALSPEQTRLYEGVAKVTPDLNSGASNEFRSALFSRQSRKT